MSIEKTRARLRESERQGDNHRTLELKLELGRLERSAGNHAQARTLLDDVLAASTDELIGRAQIELAAIDEDDGAVDAALARLNAVPGNAPAEVRRETCHRLGYLAQQAGDPETALQHLLTAAATDASSLQAADELYWAACCYQALGRPDQFEACMIEVIERGTGRFLHDAALRVGNAARERDELDQADRYYVRAAEATDEVAWMATVGLAMTSFLRGDFAAARTYIDRLETTAGDAARPAIDELRTALRHMN